MLCKNPESKRPPHEPGRDETQHGSSLTKLAAGTPDVDLEQWWSWQGTCRHAHALGRLDQLGGRIPRLLSPSSSNGRREFCCLDPKRTRTNGCKVTDGGVGSLCVLQYAQKLRYYLPTLKEKGVSISLVGIGGFEAGGPEFPSLERNSMLNGSLFCGLLHL